MLDTKEDDLGSNPSLKEIVTGMRAEFHRGKRMDPNEIIAGATLLHELGFGQNPKVGLILERLGQNPAVNQAIHTKLQAGPRENRVLISLFGLSQPGSPKKPDPNLSRRKFGQYLAGATGMALTGGAAYLAASQAPAVNRGVESVQKPVQTARAIFEPPKAKPLPLESLNPQVPSPPTPTAATTETQAPAAPTSPTGEPQPEAPFRVEVNAYARLKNAFPQLKDPLSGQPLPFDLIKNIVQSKLIEVIGYGKTNDYAFRCFDPVSQKIFDIPISQAEIVQGSPLRREQMPKLPYLGIRNDSPELMQYVAELGCSSVRVVSNNNDPIPKQRILETLEVATAAGAKVLYTYNPSITPSPEKIKQHLYQVLGRYEVDLEIGNEPDETTEAYWKDYLNGESLESFVGFIKTTIEEARKLRPGIRIVIGALVDPLKNQGRLVQGLKEAGVDLSKVDFAVHGYAKDELETRIGLVKAATGKRELVLTELGFDGDVNGVVPELIKFTRNLGVSEIYLHELGRFKDSWGYIDPQTKKFAPKAYYLQKFVVDQSQISPALHSQM